MIIKTTLEWNYTPADAFEEPYHYKAGDFELDIAEGVAIVTLAQPREHIDEEGWNFLESFVRSAFNGLQVMTHQAIELHESKMTNYHADGTRTDMVRLKVASVNLNSTTIDTVDTDSEGNIVSDSRAERIQKHHSFIDNVLQRAASDKILLPLLQSYVAAINDPVNEFVYLFEIPEKLEAYFGKKKIFEGLKTHFKGKGEKAIKAQEADTQLETLKELWNKLGRITNDRRVQESRHRGQYLDEHRPATLEEKIEARRIARELIESYVDYLEKQNKS